MDHFPVSDPESVPAQKTRARGPKPRLDQRKIVDAAIVLLQTQSVREFSMTKLAQSIGSSPMGLYTYFSSRDELLEAVADHVLSIFPSNPTPESCWQDEVRAWLNRLHDHLYNHPFALDLLAWDGHISVAWFRAWLPIYRLLNKEGLEGDPLRFALTWFLQVALGTMTSIRKTAELKLTSATPNLNAFNDADRDVLSREIAALYNVDRAAVLQFSFQNIVNGLDQLIRARED